MYVTGKPVVWEKYRGLVVNASGTYSCHFVLSNMHELSVKKKYVNCRIKQTTTLGDRYEEYIYGSNNIVYNIIYNKPTRCNSGSIVFINNYKCALNVSDALCVHLQEHYKL